MYEIDISYFGIETNAYNETIDLTTRIETLFNSDELTEQEKDELYRNIMKLYLDSKVTH